MQLACKRNSTIGVTWTMWVFVNFDRSMSWNLMIKSMKFSTEDVSSSSSSGSNFFKKYSNFIKTHETSPIISPLRNPIDPTLNPEPPLSSNTSPRSIMTLRNSSSETPVVLSIASNGWNMS
ncbi:hypothetical protein WICPIJ_000830 [Wickerhamomyces pijperi]|uniref:Uncharacterized protein n=1 Tax=Wickerhamomyces pijperi TaxID=599730 RepID=A0A9P8TQH9_WICPI|nr:hypothetical protein WICPIJ_000830 [Wickerhamomyces pijperi]